ncbi:MAG: type II secretion system protein GspM [Gemmatimonadales bacterium]|jgi:type II secretory pathway component PulM
MRIFLWLSEWFARLEPRERRVVAGGGIACAILLLTVYAIVPFAKRWSDREAAIQAKAEQLARLQSLVDSEAALQRVVAELEQGRSLRNRRLLVGTTPALASSTLQTLVRSYAEESRVTLQRVNLSEQAEPEESGLTPVGLQVTVLGDVYGLVDLLYFLQNGEKLLVIDELQVSSTRRRGADQQLMSWTLRLHGFYVEEEPA